MSSIVLPSTVEELNYMQSQSLYIKSDNTHKELENIIVANNYKQEASLFDGVSWTDYESYLNFEENQNTLRGDDCIVPGDADVRQQQQQRSDSFTSSSAMEDSKNFAYKTFSTVCVDSGSTCISSEHSYVSPSPVPNNVYRGLDEEETYQNLSAYFKQSPEVHNTDSSLSCVSPSLSESLSDYSVLNNFSAISHCSSQDGGFQEVQHTLKRPAESPDLEPFVSSKRSCSGESYSESRKKNNLSSKNCRKTRKEKQKEMEARVQELEREREQLNSSIEMLEKAIKAHHVHLCSILGSRQQMVA